MKSMTVAVLGAALAVLLFGTGCSLFAEFEFEPTGTDWTPDSSITINRVMGSQSIPTKGWLPFDLELENEDTLVVLMPVPPGLFLMSAEGTVQDVIVLADFTIEVGPGSSTHRIDAFCIDIDADLPDWDDEYTIGKVTDSDKLNRVIDLLRGKDFLRATAIDSVQDLVWEVTENDELPSAYITWLESLPDATDGPDGGRAPDPALKENFRSRH